MNLQWVGKWGKISDRNHFIADPAAQLAQFLMRPLEEIVEQAQFVDHLQGRGMDGVAAEIAEEVRVLLEHDHVDAGAREKEAEHHAGRSAAGNAAARNERFRRRRSVTYGKDWSVIHGSAS